MPIIFLFPISERGANYIRSGAAEFPRQRNLKSNRKGFDVFEPGTDIFFLGGFLFPILPEKGSE